PGGRSGGGLDMRELIGLVVRRVRRAIRSRRWRVGEPLGNSARGAGGRGGGRFTREGATKAVFGGAEQARASTRPRGVFPSALACRPPYPRPPAPRCLAQRL